MCIDQLVSARRSFLTFLVIELRNFDDHEIPHPISSLAETVCNTTLGDKQCGGPECYKVEQECDFSPDCSDGHDEAMCGACDFEDHKLCGYVHDMSADVRPFMRFCYLVLNQSSIIFVVFFLADKYS